jgi:hypothetical protein
MFRNGFTNHVKSADAIPLLVTGSNPNIRCQPGEDRHDAARPVERKRCSK